MSIIGIDFGNQFTKIFILNNGTIKSVESLSNNSKIPTLIINTNHKRWFGEDVNARINKNYKYLHHNIVDHSYNISNYANDSSPDKIYLMYFNYLNETINNFIKNNNYSNIIKTIVSIPVIRQSIKDNINIALLASNLVSTELIYNYLATGIEYGFYRSIKNEFADKTYKLFIDIGHINVSIYILSFHNNNMEVVDMQNSKHIGGYNITELLTNYFKNEFESHHTISIEMSHVIKLDKMSEQIKKALNFTNTVTKTIDFFMKILIMN